MRKGNILDVWVNQRRAFFQSHLQPCNYLLCSKYKYLHKLCWFTIKLFISIPVVILWQFLLVWCFCVCFKQIWVLRRWQQVGCVFIIAEWSCVIWNKNINSRQFVTNLNLMSNINVNSCPLQHGWAAISPGRRVRVMSAHEWRRNQFDLNWARSAKLTATGFRLCSTMLDPCWRQNC